MDDNSFEFSILVVEEIESCGESSINGG